ncbi:MAG TPA: hypothetical protein VK557_03825 [Pyrinomonadaceae bacterium]|nr:hypothetical protein [Pyrinomonadaceae bacterium]
MNSPFLTIEGGLTLSSNADPRHLKPVITPVVRPSVAVERCYEGWMTKAWVIALLFVIRKTGMDNGFPRLSSDCSGQLK